jgi:dethiobiotin synthetase
MNPLGLFISGTDTGVGKTYLTSRIIRELRAAGVRVGAYKPACSGSRRDAAGDEVWDDLQELSSALNHEFPRNRICPQTFTAPLAPPVAARLEDRTVDRDLLRSGAYWWSGRVDFLLVEGVGGLLCPLTNDEMVADLACDLGFPLIIVARLGLGTINHTLLTIEAAHRRGLVVAGIVLSEVEPADGDLAAQTNPAELSRRCQVPILGIVRHQADIELLEVGGAIRIDWVGIAGRAGKAAPPQVDQASKKTEF